MANRRGEPVSYRPFRREPVLQEGLMGVARPGGEVFERAAAGLFRLAARAGERADQEAAFAGARDGQQAALAGRPDFEVSGGEFEAGNGGSTGGGRKLTGSRAEKAQKAKAYLMSRHGLSNAAASGLVGNIAQESNFNTRAVNPGDGQDGSDSIGMIQWNGSRARALRSFARAAGKPVDDFELQLDFAIHELKTSERAAGRRLFAARSVEEATAAAIGFERPAGWTPQNPQGGHGWANRLAAARSVFGASSPAPAGTDPVTTASTVGGAAPAAAPSGVTASPEPATPSRTPVSITGSGGGFRPSGRNTVYGRAFDQEGTKTYLQLVDAEMRSTTQQLFEKYRDDPAGLETAFGDLKGELKKDHIFAEIEADFEIGFQSMADRYLGQARDNAMRRQEAVDRATFIERTSELETEQQRRLAAFDPGSDVAADAVAASQAAIDDHYDDAVIRGLMGPDDAATAKARSRRAAAVAFYGKQADMLDAAGVKAMRDEMRADFADGGIEGLDGAAWGELERSLEALENRKRAESTRTETDFRRRGDAQAARVAAGYDVDQAEMAKLTLEAEQSPNGAEIVRETWAKISAGKAIADMSVRQGRDHVAGLKKQYGKDATDAELRTIVFAESMLDAKRKAIANDSVSYAEAQGIVPETPMLTDAASPEDMEATMAARTAAAEQAAAELETSVRYLKAGEAKALADAIRKDPASGIGIAGAIVAGAGDAAGRVIAEFGSDAPMIAEAGAIMSVGGSARAAEDVILGYGKGPDGKAYTSMKPEAQTEGYSTVVGDALHFWPQDASRVRRAAGSIARKRIAEAGVAIDSEEAVAIHEVALQEAAGALFDRGVQWGGFADFDRPGWFSGAQKVIIPSVIRADAFAELVGALTDEDIAALPVQPRAGVNPWNIISGRTKRSAAETIRDGVPVAVQGGYAFAVGDPTSDDPQFIQDENGDIFVLDLLSLRERLESRVPGAFR